MVMFRILHDQQRPLKTIFTATMLTALCWSPAFAGAPRIWPNTSIRLSIVQWMPTKGLYEKWDALSGEFVVAQDGTLSLPVIGRIPVGSLDEADLAARIAEELKDKIGLVRVPEATVAVVKYPPIYVVGDVKLPGTYEFRPGLMALQALAVGGGENSSDADGSTLPDRAELVANLLGLDNSIMRTRIKIARFHAELSDGKEPKFDLPAGMESPEARAVYEQEKAVMTARSNLLERQANSFMELRDLLRVELETLDKKADSADADIKSVAKELNLFKTMVDKGIALPARQGDLERMLRSYSAARLDVSADAMRAKQNISEASRNLEGLYDRQRTEVNIELQTEQANLDQMLLKREVAQKQMLKILSKQDRTLDTGDPTMLVFSIDRLVDGRAQEIAASSDTVLQPGDVLRVTRRAKATTPETLAQNSKADAVVGTSQ
ncbi:polysaccharide biosynthesis/export family protein [Shinella sp. CPCC 101442]|uniref:polysaccharide biosynthesis/export family protein n=1 Tax=Shinella sp. CPCC 101442 TaxID=2932265 RepID=UPI002152FC5B|nr:polysaccharide biosynthesis/export family protein [Shinella sp. CPCC 101442]MCR6502425.1 polysaccharide biosynthesis/export family protein [Shinella sp. CPCC 101442]